MGKRICEWKQLTIDEHLMLSRNRTHLITYMPAKLPKYGIKFSMLVDNKMKYVYNLLRIREIK